MLAVGPYAVELWRSECDAVTLMEWAHECREPYFIYFHYRQPVCTEKDFLFLVRQCPIMQCPMGSKTWFLGVDLVLLHLLLVRGTLTEV